MFTCYPFKGKPGNLIPSPCETTNAAKDCMGQGSFSRKLSNHKRFPKIRAQHTQTYQSQLFFLTQDQIIPPKRVEKLTWWTMGARGYEPIFFGRFFTGSLRVPYGFPTGFENTMFLNYFKIYGVPTGYLWVSTGRVRVKDGFPTDKTGSLTFLHQNSPKFTKSKKIWRKCSKNCLGYSFSSKNVFKSIPTNPLKCPIVQVPPL